MFKNLLLQLMVWVLVLLCLIKLGYCQIMEMWVFKSQQHQAETVSGTLWEDAHENQAEIVFTQCHSQRLSCHLKPCWVPLGLPPTSGEHSTTSFSLLCARSQRGLGEENSEPKSLCPGSGRVGHLYFERGRTSALSLIRAVRIRQIAKDGWKSLWLRKSAWASWKRCPLNRSQKMGGIWANGNGALGKKLPTEKEYVKKILKSWDPVGNLGV